MKALLCTLSLGLVFCATPVESAQITINVPDNKIVAYRNNLAEMWKYDDYVVAATEAGETPLTKGKYVKRMIINTINEQLKRYLLNKEAAIINDTVNTTISDFQVD